jgi:hypothetical protein
MGAVTPFGELVPWSTPMKTLGMRIRLMMAALLMMAAPKLASGQAPLEPAQMPPRTLCYVIWRGVPSAEARKGNALLALWEDEDFAPVKSAMAAGMLNSPGEKTGQPKLTREQVQEYAGLLENGFTVGYISAPVRRSLSTGTAAEAKPGWNGMFFVYDRSGKEMLLAKVILGIRANEKEAPQISQVTIGGTTVLKTESKGGTTYWAEQGKYAVSAGERSVMEELLGRLGGKAAGTTSLAQNAAYQEVQANLGGGLVEFFLRVPDIKEFASDAKAGPIQVTPLLDAAKLDSVHSVSGRILFDGARTRLQAAIVGDTAHGTLFDIWGDGQTAPASLAFAPADAISYTSGQVNLQGIYDTVKRVARAAFPQTQQGGIDLMDALAQQKLGMPVPEALALPTGEFASMQTSPSMDTAKQVYFFGIRKKPETLKLLRTVLSEQISSERNEGDVTFLKISLGGKQSGAGTAQWNFFNVAVTQDMVIGATRAETIREVLAGRAHNADAGLGNVPQFKSGREHYPGSLNGVSYFDLQKVDWPALKSRWIEEQKKNSMAKAANASKDGLPTPSSEWIERINPQVFPRHLHYSSSVSWKDSKGIHWEQWIE